MCTINCRTMGLTFCFSLSLRSTCYQVAAVLCKVEHALKNGLTLFLFLFIDKKN